SHRARELQARAEYERGVVGGPHSGGERPLPELAGEVGDPSRGARRPGIPVRVPGRPATGAPGAGWSTTRPAAPGDGRGRRSSARASAPGGGGAAARHLGPRRRGTPAENLAGSRDVVGARARVTLV